MKKKILNKIKSNIKKYGENKAFYHKVNMMKGVNKCEGAIEAMIEFSTFINKIKRK